MGKGFIGAGKTAGFGRMSESKFGDIELYFEPKYEEFPVTHKLEPLACVHIGVQGTRPIPQFKATAKLGEFLEVRVSQSSWVAASKRSLTMTQ